jgi:hypothetical protein
MKKKLFLAVISIVFTFSAIADTQPTLSREEIDKQNKEILAKKGLYLPDYNEINMVSANKFISKKNMKGSNYDAEMANTVKKYLSMNAEQQKNGYVKEDKPRAKELLNLKNTSSFHKKKYKNIFSFHSTHMRDSINDLKLAYTYVGVPAAEMDNNIGLAPYGSYKSVKNGDEGDGWDGAVQFFDKKGIGSAFTEHNRKLAGVGVELIKELVSYDVQNKPTIVLVKGNNISPEDNKFILAGVLCNNSQFGL